ncbi:hypothetical protein VNO77_43357 [Canavalia gladiata]|uniref:Uncharacterized protein n=1 Tax=Canavalia gladiata TaxID=3824 RepID=A0AAN9PPB5_CANGL
MLYIHNGYTKATLLTMSKFIDELKNQLSFLVERWKNFEMFCIAERVRHRYYTHTGTRHTIAERLRDERYRSLFFLHKNLSVY